MLTTLEGHYLRSMVLGNRLLRRQLEARGADPETSRFYGLVEAAFGIAIAQLGRGRLGPAELHYLAEQAAQAARYSYPVTADDVARTIRHELGDPVLVTDIGGQLEVAVKCGVVAAAARRLRLTPSGVTSLIRQAELQAEEWGFDATVYRPGPLVRLGQRFAELTWSAWHMRRGRHHVRRVTLPRDSRAH